MRPSDILASIRLRRGPDATEKAIFDAFFVQSENDPEARLLLAREWFGENFKRSTVIAVSANEYEIIEQSPSMMNHRPAVPAIPERREEARAREVAREQVKEWKEQVRTALAMTMRFVLPNGQELQRAQAGYVRSINGVMADLVRGLPDNVIVGAHRTENDLQNLLA